LKGKFLNVKETDQEKIKTDQQLQSMMKAIGLTFGKVKVEELRYQSVMIIASSDTLGV
jgi:DNA gyrase/topoisomerase IV subunit B